MSYFFRHRKSKTQLNFPENPVKPSSSISNAPSSPLKKSAVDGRFELINRFKTINKKTNTSLEPTTVSANPKKSKYTHFPKESDFVNKNNAFSAVESPQKTKLQQEKASGTIVIRPVTQGTTPQRPSYDIPKVNFQNYQYNRFQYGNSPLTLTNKQKSSGQEPLTQPAKINKGLLEVPNIRQFDL